MKLTVKFSIENHDISVGEEARMWIDVNRDRVLSADEDVDLFKDDLKWTGSVSSTQTSSMNMPFTLKFIASPGTAKWALEVRSDTPNDHVVYDGKGDVEFLQNILVGVLDP